ncbi:low temperature requirement protein A [Paenibacillus sp. sgz500958]|uniref:low temperature requirement protein A n=1 Tax=Paenibacillus sp. sgz500958 TaxID=3242475 RepID=UPI0036D3A1AD
MNIAHVGKKVTWLELFYDLLFVAAVSKVSHVLLHVEHGTIPAVYLFKFILIMVPVWWAWVGQSLFVNRYGQDSFSHRIFLILQLFFSLIMTSSLSVDFDAYYLSFFIGYVGLRAMTAIQYLSISRREHNDRKITAFYLGSRIWIGLGISSFSLFFDSWIRYAVLFAGIVVDIAFPLLGRRHLGRTSINTYHLIERFALFTLILLGEIIISILGVLQSGPWTWEALIFAVFTFLLAIGIWWQYFDNVEKKVNKSLQTRGQLIIYGHLIIFMSLSMIAASIRLLFLEQPDYSFIINFMFGSVFLYFLSTTLVFHKYRPHDERLGIYHLALLMGTLGGLYVLSLLMVVPGYALMGGLALFFGLYAKLTT